jgi:hypothetical protein
MVTHTQTKPVLLLEHACPFWGQRDAYVVLASMACVGAGCAVVYFTMSKPLLKRLMTKYSTTKAPVVSSHNTTSYTQHQHAYHNSDLRCCACL